MSTEEDAHALDRAFLASLCRAFDPRALVRSISRTPPWRAEATRRRISDLIRLHEWADGFRYIENAITFPETSALAYRCQWELDQTGARLETGSICNGRSRVVRFGIDLHGHEVARWPEWARDLRHRLSARVMGVARADHLTINEYQPGDSIWAHTDDFGYDTPIVTVSVGAPARLVLSRAADRIRLEMVAGSAVVLDRDAARACKHAIEAWDEQPGIRWSIVFRVRAVAT